jgi:hypothetical protein
VRDGALYVETLKNNWARTVPPVFDLVPIVDRYPPARLLAVATEYLYLAVERFNTPLSTRRIAATLIGL